MEPTSKGDERSGARLAAECCDFAKDQTMISSWHYVMNVALDMPGRST
jgi:hypothetical protein